MGIINEMFEKLPVLNDRKDPTLSAILGLLFGGIGLGIYFRSFIDFLLPILITMVFVAIFEDVGFLGGVLFASIYGYFRALTSNQKMGIKERVGEGPWKRWPTI
ncbi:MAG TPA: hypothetical protein VHP36_05355 [Chitinispirillaceae bacterium]|nr:hypothetical protein [Chitinispirillaceae bacterium]